MADALYLVSWEENLYLLTMNKGFLSICFVYFCDVGDGIRPGNLCLVLESNHLLVSV